MPFQFLHFVYYIFCRRDKMFMPDADKPAITASYSFTFLMAWPIAAVLGLLNHFTGWWPVWTQWWLTMHLPGHGQKAAAYAFTAILIVITLIVYKALFGKQRYDWIMQRFPAYDPTRRTIAPNLFFFFPLVPVAGICVYAVNANPVRGNLIVWTILLADELAFRLWWRWWTSRHDDSQQNHAPGAV